MAREEQKMRSDAVRQAILDTALEIGLEEGFEAVSIRKIIRRMKYSTGVIYHYFKDKQEVIDAVEASQTAWLSGEIRAILGEEKDGLSGMLAVFRRVMRLAVEEPERYNLIVLHKYARKNPSAAPWIDYLSGTLRAEMESGRLRAMDPARAAFSVWSSFLGFNLMISRQRGITMEAANELFETQKDIILKGVLKDG